VLLLSEHIAKHLIKIEGYENRILVLTLCFRKNINIKIIIVYLPANSKHYNDTEKCNTIIKNQINMALRHNHQIILLGDFNIDVKDIKEKKNTGDKNWKLKKELITYINSQHLTDNIRSFHDNPPTTWTSQSHENTVKRLDYIYTTQEIFDHTFYGYVEAINDIYFTTDHKLVAILLNKEYFLKYRQYCKYSNFSQNREIIIYKNIPDNYKKYLKTVWIS
jgi:exonuclease III